MNRKMPRYSPKVFIYGTATPEEIVAAMENFVSWEAALFADEAPQSSDTSLAQDLEQDAWLFVFRQIQRDPDIWARKLERLTYLSFKNALRRGRSVFRPDPGKRTRQYERVSLSQIQPESVCTSFLPFDQEHALLLKALGWARSAGDREAEHQAILMLRRLARRYQRDDLRTLYNSALRDWWRETRALEA